ncbi:hypothetical protein BGZ72_008209 [Mortierella alpina]|nr:hypothetical protein BGZ72_008209 [Mortierella alpina]
MSPTTIHSIFGMPELAECLSRYLTTSDVACAMTVCKAWSKQLQPFLWTTFCPAYMLPRMHAIKQNLHHIRAIELNLPTMHTFRSDELNSFGDLLETLTHGLLIPPTALSKEIFVGHEPAKSAGARMALCTNLKRLKFVLGLSERELGEFFGPPLKTLLSYNRNLTHLHVQIEGLHDFLLPSMVQLLPAQRHLQSLTIHARIQKESWFFSLLRACLPLPKLSELYCHFTVESDAHTSEGKPLDEPVKESEAVLETILQEAIAARTSENGTIDTKIKAIRFPDHKEGDSLSIVLPIMRSDLVELDTIEIPFLINTLQGEDSCEKMVRQHCPELKHLIIPHYGYFMQSDMALFFIRGAAGLKTVRGDHFSDAFGWSSRNIIRTLAAHHSSTLEELELLDCRMLSSPDQQAILTSCKQLKRFWVVPNGISQGERGLKFQHIIEGEWGCLGLKALCLALNRTINVEAVVMAMQQEQLPSNDSKPIEERGHEGPADEQGRNLAQGQENKAIAWAAKRVYSQIGRLVALETLVLETDQVWYGKEEDVLLAEWDLTLSKGWLAELAGLKSLRHLHMRTDYWSRMGQAEVEFMDTEWPLLGEISFDLQKSDFLQLVMQPHWQWLKQKRPNLLLSALHL